MDVALPQDHNEVRASRAELPRLREARLHRHPAAPADVPVQVHVIPMLPTRGVVGCALHSGIACCRSTRDMSAPGVARMMASTRRDADGRADRVTRRRLRDVSSASPSRRSAVENSCVARLMKDARRARARLCIVACCVMSRTLSTRQHRFSDTCPAKSFVCDPWIYRMDSRLRVAAHARAGHRAPVASVGYRAAGGSRALPRAGTPARAVARGSLAVTRTGPPSTAGGSTSREGQQGGVCW